MLIIIINYDDDFTKKFKILFNNWKIFYKIDDDNIIKIN